MRLDFLFQNPFFVSKGEDPEVKNQVSEAIYRRIVRAYEKHENFRVYIVLPVSKGLAGKGKGGMVWVLGYTYPPGVWGQTCKGSYYFCFSSGT